MSRWYFAVFVSARNVMPRNCMRNVGEDADGDDERGLTRGLTRGRQHFALAVGVPGGLTSGLTRGRQLDPSGGGVNPLMRSWALLVERGPGCPRSTERVNVRIEGLKWPPQG